MKNVLRFIVLLLVTALTVWGIVVAASAAVGELPGFRPLRSLAVLGLIHASVSLVGGFVAGFLLRGSRWQPLLLVLPLFFWGLLPSLGDLPHGAIFAKSMLLLLIACASFLVGLRISNRTHAQNIALGASS